MLERPYSCCRGAGEVFIILVLAVFLLANPVIGAEKSDDSQTERYQVFNLRNISAEAGRDYLGKAKIGTASILPGKNMLLVTASAVELLKARAILGVADTAEQYSFEKIFSVSEAGVLPLPEQISAEIGGITVGTFADPPMGNEKAKVIVDAGMDEVKVGQDQVVGDVNAPLQAEAPAGEEMEIEVVSDEELKSDELFGELLKSIAEAEEKAAEEGVEEVRKLEERLEAAKEVPVKPGSLLEQFSEEEIAALLEELLAKKRAEKVAAVAELKAEEAAAAGKIVEAAPRQSYEPEMIDEGDAMLDLDLPEQLEIKDLLSLVGQYLGLDYMYDSSKVKGAVSLNLRGPIKVRDLYPLLQSVLKFQGFVMTRSGNLVTIVPIAEALSIDPTLHTDERGIRLGEVVITRIVELQHVDTTSAKNLLDGMKLGANITAIEGTKTLIITEYAHRMARIEELLSVIDRPGDPKKFRFRQLKYTLAATLAPKIKSLVEQLGDISITVAAPAAPTPTPARRGARPARPAPRQPVTAPGQVGVYLDADERTNRILMIGLEKDLEMVEELIEALDVEQQDLRTLRLYDIQFVGAEEVLQKLEELGIVTPSVRSTGRMGLRGQRTTQTQRQRQQQQQQTRTTARTTTPTTGVTGTTGEETPVEEPQVVIIESTNSLLANATPEQHIQIATIIGYVDSETLKTEIPYRIYSLENQDPVDLAEILQKLIQETIQDKEGKIQEVVQRQEEQIVIVPDEGTFSLIVYASKKNQVWIENLIRSLDKRRPQVLIDVTLVEVTRTDLFDLDLQLVRKWPTLDPGGTMESGGLVDALVSPFPGRVREFSSISGTGTGFYSDHHIQALLTAVQSKNYGRVLAKPKILVNDGQPGVISTQDTRYVRIESIVQGGIDKPDQIVANFESYPAGIMLTITPNISEGDLLLLEVELTRSDFLVTSETGVPPNTTESQINTIVTVPNERTIILGGMLKLNQSKGGSKVPLLGDLPFIGGLFRSTSNSATDSKLYIFVKANILRPDETLKGLPELERISERNAAAFEESEEEFQRHEDWPGIEPEPMDPLKVLEAE